MKIHDHHAIVLFALLLMVIVPKGNGQIPDSLKKIEDQYVAAFQLHVEEGHQSKIAELDTRYAAALEKALQAASKGDRLEEALALKDEMKRVQAKEPLPEKDEGAQPAVVRFRNTYREQLAKLVADRERVAAPIVKKFEEALAAHQSALTKEGKIEDAAAVKAYRESGVPAKLLGDKLLVAFLANPPGNSNVRRGPVLAAATKEKPFENSLGMKFVPVRGTNLLFCIHETRWKDYSEYAKANPGIDGSWQSQNSTGFQVSNRSEEHPAVCVSWDEATAFCKWLSEKEKKTYRLPTDREWSIAVGLGRKEKWRKADTPESIEKDQSEFPWGTGWPPPKGEGNYSDQSRKAKAPGSGAKYIDAYDDGHPTTAPVMSFKPNEFGLYDMGGNVWEWVEDWWNEAKTDRVWRGGSWVDFVRNIMLSSFRGHGAPDTRGNNRGFRVVLVGSGG